MTLVETVVALGVASILILGVMQMSTFSTRVSKSASLQNDWTNLVAGIRLVLGNGNSCTAVFHGKHYDLASVMPVSEISAGPTVGTLAKVGAPLTGLQVTAMDLRDSGQTPVPEVLGTPPVARARFMAKLTVAARKIVSGGGAVGSSAYSQEFLLDVVVDPATQLIDTCFAEYSPAQSCIDLGGTYDDTTTPKCQVPGVLQACVTVNSAGRTDTTDAGGVAITTAQAKCPAGTKLISGGCACAAGGITMESCIPNYGTQIFTVACQHQGVDPQVVAYCCKM